MINNKIDNLIFTFRKIEKIIYLNIIYNNNNYIYNI